LKKGLSAFSDSPFLKEAQFVANLRVANMSGLWHKVINLIKLAA